MGHETTTTSANPLWKRVVAALFLVAFLGINFVSASHSAHHAMHEEAGAPTHDCVFVQVSNAQFAADAPVMVAPIPVLEVAFVAEPVRRIEFRSTDYVLLPGRAPPASLA